jgi:hypothetical protein
MAEFYERLGLAFKSGAGWAIAVATACDLKELRYIEDRRRYFSEQSLRRCRAELGRDPTWLEREVDVDLRDSSHVVTRSRSRR